MTFRVAIDMEAVLADTHKEVLKRWNHAQGTDHGPESFESWVLEDSPHGMTFEEFDCLSDEAWADVGSDPNSIPAMNASCDAHALDRLADHPRFVYDIVTARQGRETEMEGWLAYHGIVSYHRFVSCPPGYGKWRYGYDLYVDDNPTMENVSIQYMVEQPYNEHRRGDYGVHHVASVADAVDAIISEYGDTTPPWWETDRPLGEDPGLTDPDLLAELRRHQERLAARRDRGE